MKVRVVRDRGGKVVCVVPMEQTALNEVLVEPVLEDGQQAEDLEVMRSELIDMEGFFATYSRAPSAQP